LKEKKQNSHDSVDESIKNNREVNITVIIDARIEPIEEVDRRVMVNMEETQLVPLFPQDDEDGVPEVP